MLDRHGNNIIVGFSASEVIWIEAVLTLPIYERRAAYQDIADMTGRDVKAILNQAKIIRKQQAIYAAREAAARAVRVPDHLPHPGATIPLPFISKPSLARLMGAR